MITLPDLNKIKAWAEPQPAGTSVGRSNLTLSCPIANAFAALCGGTWKVDIDEIERLDEYGYYPTPTEIAEVIIAVDHHGGPTVVPSYYVTREDLLQIIATVQAEVSKAE